MGSASAATTGAAKPHGHVDVATGAAVEEGGAWSGSFCGLVMPGHRSLVPCHKKGHKHLTQWKSNHQSWFYRGTAAGHFWNSSGAPRSMRINKPKFPLWQQSQSSNQGGTGGACATSKPHSDLLQQLSCAQNQTPLQLIFPYIVHSSIKWKISMPWTERFWYPSCWVTIKSEDWHGSTC